MIPMFERVRRLSLAIFGVGVLFVAAPTETAAYDVYYVSVGNAQYRDSDLNIPDANLSARQITYYLRQAGARDGITLLSEEGAYVTNDDVIDAIDRVAAQASNARDPLLVYYFIGHGRTTEPGGIHVSLTGSYRKSASGGQAHRQGLIETRALQDRLEESKVPYLLILDNCYFRQPVGGFQAFGRALGDKLMEQAETLDSLSFGRDDEPRDPRIVFYAASPGNVVRTVQHPWNERYSVGPLARRLLLLLDATLEAGQRLSIGRFLESINDAGFDPGSAVGHQTVHVDRRAATFVPAGSKSDSEDALGTILRGSAGAND